VRCRRCMGSRRTLLWHPEQVSKFAERRMSVKARTWLLLEALKNEEDFRNRGFTADFGASGGVVIERSGHFRGIWTSRAGQFVWTAAGYNEPNFQTSSVPDALKHTLDAVSKF
jgi:hypothetical protein